MKIFTMTKGLIVCLIKVTCMLMFNSSSKIKTMFHSIIKQFVPYLFDQKRFLRYL